MFNALLWVTVFLVITLFLGGRWEVSVGVPCILRHLQSSCGNCQGMPHRNHFVFQVLLVEGKGIVCINELGILTVRQ